ncbi:MAG: hypothetical protein RSC68_00140 [Acinetobacter sp.]
MVTLYAVLTAVALMGILVAGSGATFLVANLRAGGTLSITGIVCITIFMLVGALWVSCCNILQHGDYSVYDCNAARKALSKVRSVQDSQYMQLNSMRPDRRQLALDILYTLVMENTDISLDVLHTVTSEIIEVASYNWKDAGSLEMIHRLGQYALRYEPHTWSDLFVIATETPVTVDCLDIIVKYMEKRQCKYSATTVCINSEFNLYTHMIHLDLLPIAMALATQPYGENGLNKLIQLYDAEYIKTRESGIKSYYKNTVEVAMQRGV